MKWWSFMHKDDNDSKVSVLDSLLHKLSAECYCLMSQIGTDFVFLSAYGIDFCLPINSITPSQIVSHQENGTSNCFPELFFF